MINSGRVNAVSQQLRLASSTNRQLHRQGKQLPGCRQECRRDPNLHSLHLEAKVMLYKTQDDAFLNCYSAKFPTDRRGLSKV